MLRAWNILNNLMNAKTISNHKSIKSLEIGYLVDLTNDNLSEIITWKLVNYCI